MINLPEHRLNDVPNRQCFLVKKKKLTIIYDTCDEV